MTLRMRVESRVRRLTDEVTILRGRVVNHEVLSAAKDDAMREFVNIRIAQWNKAIRATNGPRRGESAESYRARLVAANARDMEGEG